jgi:glycosyltransferase involved in cell wall biosynthesis
LLHFSHVRLAYLYSRYPVLSQTFCDTEMLELERRGYPLLIGSIHPPLTSIRHAHAARLKAPVHYAPPPAILRFWEDEAKEKLRWPKELIAAHEQRYGAAFKPALRARNASYFAALFKREGIQHFHVHFANRAAHTALFLKEISGIPFSITAHGQDFMSDLGNEDLLREICAAAEFVAVETDYSRGLLSARCPDSLAKIHRVYNGMELSNFASVQPVDVGVRTTRILSVGRLVAFKGFDVLIAACAELKRLGIDFTCEIVGDGPLRETLQAQIGEHQLSANVKLAGALPQQAIFAKLRECDIFALASRIDAAGASDVFPTVILEAMASSRPIVSTTVAGIPEAVVHGLTGLLAPADDTGALAKAMQRLIEDQWLRVTFGHAGRARVEQYFQVETTIAPLMALFERIAETLPGDRLAPPASKSASAVAYLVETWPDPGLPMLAEELDAMESRGVAITTFVAAPGAELRGTRKLQRLATRLVFLPDPIVVEAEWETHRELAHALEEDRGNQPNRAPAGAFLQQARYAIALRPMLRQNNITHVHAASSGMLLCAVMLKKLCGITVSAAVEAKPKLPTGTIRAALAECVGGRVSTTNLVDGMEGAFLQDSSRARSLQILRKTVGIDLAGRAKLWREWSELLLRWR